jgi:hypothetical protein
MQKSKRKPDTRQRWSGHVRAGVAFPNNRKMTTNLQCQNKQWDMLEFAKDLANSV